MYHKSVKLSPVNTFFTWLARIVLRVSGWKSDIERPPVAKCVVLGVPHTSNWDLFFTLAAAMKGHVPIWFMMKDSMFWWPISLLWKRLGGIPVNRRQRTNAVQQMVEAFGKMDELFLTIPPQGTRKKVDYWKTGFYWIANGAGVPIWPCYINYKTKFVGSGPLVYTTGDIDADFAAIRAFYEGVVGPMPSCRPAPRNDTPESRPGA